MEKKELDQDLVQTFSFNIRNTILCSNKNRAGIIYLLNKIPDKELEVEKIANKLGITHRTALYHLSILADHNFVEVRKFRKKGGKNLRSVWGIKNGNKDFGPLFKKIEEYFPKEDLEALTSRNINRR